MDAEGRQLLVQLQDIIRDFGELEEVCQGADPEPERTLFRTYEIQRRRGELMYEWSMLQSEIPDQTNAELERGLEELRKRQRLLAEARSDAQMKVAEAVGRRVLVEVKNIIRDFGELQERWWGPDSEDQILLLHDRTLEFLTEWSDTRKLIPVEISAELDRRIKELNEQWKRFRERAPLAREARENIPITTVSCEHISDNSNITSNCPICLEDFELGEEASQPHCGHIFHKNCISQWWRSNNTCPVCRRAMDNIGPHLYRLA